MRCMNIFYNVYMALIMGTNIVKWWQEEEEEYCMFAELESCRPGRGERKLQLKRFGPNRVAADMEGNGEFYFLDEF